MAAIKFHVSISGNWEIAKQIFRAKVFEMLWNFVVYLLLAPPIISLPSEPFIATLGSIVTFPECKVVSSPSAKITWKRGFGIFPERRTYKTHGILRISDVKVEDEGYYECHAINYLGNCCIYCPLYYNSSALG